MTAFEALQHNRAHLFHRAAAEQHSCGLSINARSFSPTLPAPLNHESSALKEKRLKGQGSKVAFCREGVGQFSKDGSRSCIKLICHYALPSGSKVKWSIRKNQKLHVSLSFIPGSANLFHPHAFFRIQPVYLSIYLFLRRERRKKGGGFSGKYQSTKHGVSSTCGNKQVPRKFRASTGLLWMPCRPVAQCWCGFQAFFGSFRASTARNAPGLFLRPHHGH